MAHSIHETTLKWSRARAIREAKRYARSEPTGAFVFKLADGSYGWANCHPGWGWLREGERLMAIVHYGGGVERLDKRQKVRLPA
jgi:hypothetical protein